MLVLGQFQKLSLGQKRPSAQGPQWGQVYIMMQSGNLGEKSFVASVKKYNI